MKVLLNLVFTSRASWKTLPAAKSTCLSFRLASALSRAPVRRARARSAWFLRSISVPTGIVAMTCFTCSSVGTGRWRLAVATRESLSEKLKYSASE